MNAQETAETTALRVLTWLFSDPELIEPFLAATGADPGQIAGLARDAHFLAAVVDFCLESDARVIACAAALGLPPEAIGQARMGLPGGRDPHWT